MGGFILLIPELIFCWYALQLDNSKYMVMVIWFLPVTPFIMIAINLSIAHSPLYYSYVLLHIEWVPAWLPWILLLINIPLWLYIFRYLEVVMPSEFGVRKHPCFCLKKRKSNQNEPFLPADIEAIHESVLNLNDPIKFKKLTKSFGSFKAVSDLSFSIREGEVFTFLGHNGAGKTTTIFMMTGMLKSSSGDCQIYGYSINDSMDIIQKNLGLCQQFDVLFDLMTVREHLTLVCELKNVPQ